ncbi:MAG: hypothetical protein KQH57_12895 [Actinomycetales bacterium]|nr:hypothetical protein [Actinomycetales bacterium]
MTDHEAAGRAARQGETREVLDLAEAGAGRWLIETASRSCYRVSVDGEGGVTFVRTPRSAHSRPVDGAWPSADLRRDGESVRVLSVGRMSVSDDGGTSLVAEIRVGFPAVWVVEPLAEDADFTMRMTTDVVAISRLAPGAT